MIPGPERLSQIIPITHQTDEEEDDGEKKDGMGFHEKDGDNFRAAHPHAAAAPILKGNKNLRDANFRRIVRKKSLNSDAFWDATQEFLNQF